MKYVLINIDLGFYAKYVAGTNGKFVETCHGTNVVIFDSEEAARGHAKAHKFIEEWWKPITVDEFDLMRMMKS